MSKPRCLPFLLALLSVAGLRLFWSGGRLAVSHLETATAIPVGSPDSLEGVWEGVVVDGRLRHGFAVHLVFRDDQWRGTIIAPAWGKAEWPINRVSVDGKRVLMEIGPGHAPLGVFDGTVGDRVVKGSYTRQGESCVFTMSRDRVPEAHRRVRPQFPEPPLPYDTEPVSFANGDLRLGGGLTIPRGGGPHPAIVLVGGSGQSPWHAAIPGDWNPSLALEVWADKLARIGVATLRMDSRGVGGSAGNKDDTTLSALADDVLAGLRFLRARKEVDSAQMGAFGISEGASVVTIAAVRSPDVSMVVRLSGLGVPGVEGRVEEFRRISSASGADRHFALEPTVIWFRHLYELCGSDASASEIREAMKSWEADQVKNGKPLGHYRSDRFLDDALRTAATPLMRTTLRYDPRTDLRLLKVPVLDVHGDNDVFVPADQSVPEIESALTDSRNQDATVWTLVGLDHFMGKSKTGIPSGDPMDTDVVDSGALRDVIGWISKRMPRADPAK